MRILLAVTLTAGLAGCTTVDKIDSAIAAQSARFEAFCGQYDALEPNLVALINAGVISGNAAAKATQAAAYVDAVCAAPPKTLADIAILGTQLVILNKIMKDN